MFEGIRDFAIEDIKLALDTDDKKVRDERLKPIYEAVHENLTKFILIPRLRLMSAFTSHKNSCPSLAS